MLPFSVLISIYTKENPAYFKASLESITHQSLIPNEIVLIKDGPLTNALEQQIIDFSNECAYLKVYTIEKNVGLGKALQFGLEKCSYELVARMDTDDICYYERFEEQLNYMQLYPNIAVLGTYIQEFQYVFNDLKTIKSAPVKYNNLKTYAKYRNPINHPTAIFRKSAILQVGSYKDMPLFEDYYLWLRLLKQGYIFQNIPKPLLYFRVDKNMLGRRHGFKYLKKEFIFLYTAYRENLISFITFISSLLIRLPVRLLPKFFFTLMYKTILRK